MLSFFNLWTFLLPGSLLGLLVTGSPTSSTGLTKVRQTFEEFKVPTDVHINFDPVMQFEVDFPQPGGVAPIYVTEPGTQLQPNVTAGPPQFALCRSDDATSPAADGPFVIAVVDPDAPRPRAPNVVQFLHFIGGGYHADDAAQAAQQRSRAWTRSEDSMYLKLSNDTPAIIELLPLQPPAGSGSDPHRYVFLVYQEPPNFSRQTLVNSSTSRIGFNISTFAAVTGLGDPLGGTLILVRPES